MVPELPLDQVRTLLAAADAGTFEAAARILNVTPSAISQRIKALEQRVGRVLLARTKPLTLTESGEVLVRYARQLTRLEADAAAELGLGRGSAGEAQAATTLAVAVNADSLATWFLPALARVPEELRVGFELHREDQEHTAELLGSGGVAAAVTSSARPVAGCRVRRLGVMTYRACATPAFAERWLRGAPLPERLPSAPVVVFDRRDDLQDEFLRGLTGRSTHPHVRHLIPASESYLRAVASGLGWGMIPDEQEAQLPPGTIVDLAPGHEVVVELYWQQWKLDSPALAALTEAVVEAARGLGQRGGRARGAGGGRRKVST
jgi:LysR family transcriptional regulator (chromosome initiation inhibitor)